MWPLIIILLALVVVLVVLRGSPLLAKLEVRQGSVRLTGGRLPARLRDDFEDVLADRAIEKAEVRIVVENGQPRVLARGLDSGRQQRLRNVLGPYSVARIRAR